MRNDITYETAILYKTAINPKGAVVTENDFNNGTIRYGYSFYGFGAEINEITDRYVEDTNRMVWKTIDRTKEYTLYYRIIYNDHLGVTVATDFGSIDIIPEKVKSSVPSGTYSEEKSINLSYADTEAEIRFIMYDSASPPSQIDLSSVYDIYGVMPMEIFPDVEWTCVIHAQAWKDGVAVSAVESFEYNMKKAEIEEEEEMKEVLLGLLFLKIRLVGTTEWTELGDSKTEAKFKYEEKFADVKTVESGNVDKVLESTTTSIEVGISQISKALIDKLSVSIKSVTEGTAPNDITYLEGGAGIGTVAPKFEIIAHPIEEGETVTEYDVYFPKATVETSLDKTGKAGDQLVYNLKMEALFDRDKKCKFRIGKNPA